MLRDIKEEAKEEAMFMRILLKDLFSAGQSEDCIATDTLKDCKCRRTAWAKKAHNRI